MLWCIGTIHHSSPHQHPMLTDTQIKNRRDAILLEMQAIRQMVRGHISQQTLTRTGPDGSIQRRGPYFLFQRWLDGKNRSERIPKEDLPPLQRAVEGYQQFIKLADEFAELTEILTERSGPLLPSKKNSSPKPSRTNIRKPRPSSNSLSSE